MKHHIVTKHICYFGVFAVTLWLAGLTTTGRAAGNEGCVILGNDDKPFTGQNHDPLFQILKSPGKCPGNVFDLRALLEKRGLTLHPSFVGNRGYDNPLPEGSFSFFEGVTGTLDGGKLAFGDFFFGHFTEATPARKPTTLSAQQEPDPGNLMIELIVWDSKKGWYNFYEMRGAGKAGVWYYRGDSMDIANDLAKLHRNTNPTQPVFGQTLRCSACHMHGGPIMKELSLPNNSWWRKDRPLPLGGLKVAPDIQPIFDKIVDAGDFSQWIKTGVDKLQASPSYRKARSKLTLQEQLRPLFCEMEVNIDSDLEPLTGSGEEVQVPVGFFVDPRLVPQGAPTIKISKKLYMSALTSFGSSFTDKDQGPRPTDPVDADHPWLTPVKAYSDTQAVDALVKQGLIDQAFVVAVLAVDMTRPMLFNSRSDLLLLVPQQFTPDWKDKFIENLRASKSPAAQELLKNLTSPERTVAFQQKQAQTLLEKVQAQVANQDYVTSLVRLLVQRRGEVFASVLSQDPLGQIFEPEFRVIFPNMSQLSKYLYPSGLSAQFWLTPDGKVETGEHNP